MATVYNKEEITVSSAVVSTLDATIVTAGGASATAFLTVEAFAIRAWVNGSTPSATAGHELLPNDVLEFESSSEMTGFKASNLNTVGAHIGKLKVTYLQ